MTAQYVESQVQTIRSHIKRGRFEEALNQLEKFIQKVADKELDKQLVSLSARYNVDLKEKFMGIQTRNEEQNKWIYALTQILGEAKEMALEKMTLNATHKLEKMTEQGSNILEKLEGMMKLMVESRLLEIEITRVTFDHILNREQKKKMEIHIRRFKELLE